MNDPIAAAFNRQCTAGDIGLLRAMDAATEHFPPAFREFRESRGDGLLSRPLFAPAGETANFADRLTSLFDLLAELPQRVFDGDLALYCDAAGIEAARARQVRRSASRPPTFFGRADAYLSGGTFKLLEFNMCSAIGGIDCAVILDALLRVPAFESFAAEHDLGYPDTGRIVASALRSAAATVTGAEVPTVALVAPDGELADHRGHLTSYAEQFTRFGVRALTGEIGAISPRGARLYLDGEPVDVVMRFFNDLELVSSAGDGSAAEEILRAHEEGRVVLWTGLENLRVNSKGALALLADERVRAALTEAEATLVDLVLPWTRRLAPVPTLVGGKRVDLVEYCRENRDRLLLKPSFGHGGAGLVIGWQTEDAAWARLLDDAVAGAWIVQERVVPDEERVVDPDSRVVRCWAAVWGALVTPTGYAGMHIRAVPADSPDPVIRGQAAGARATAAFHYPDPVPECAP